MIETTYGSFFVGLVDLSLVTLVVIESLIFKILQLLTRCIQSGIYIALVRAGVKIAESQITKEASFRVALQLAAPWRSACLRRINIRPQRAHTRQV